MITAIITVQISLIIYDVWSIFRKTYGPEINYPM